MIYDIVVVVVVVVVIDDDDDGKDNLIHDVGLVNMASVNTCKVVAVTIVALGVVIITQHNFNLNHPANAQDVIC